jgi:UDP-N-acetylmuramate dehydrogenase
MPISENLSLRSLNTFGIDVRARYFANVHTTEDLQELLIADEWKHLPKLVLGGGSNILFTKDVNGLVIKNEIDGKAVLNEDETYVYVKAGAGENWHRFVQFCIGNNYAGIENLSLIPGNVGASPMQNIGAYGVEIKDVFFELEALHIPDNTIVKFSAEACAFGYRDSVFKHKYKNEFIILSVIYRLHKHPHFNIRYGAIEKELEAMGVQELSIKAISQAVINIRTAKLPDPAKIGNAGSFFKNPQVSSAQYQELKNNYPAIVGYPMEDGTVKLAAGWLIEQCGWKGYREGDAGVHEKQALVLVNYGHATGQEIYALSARIAGDVQQKFGVMLEREVNVW